jgi:DNA-directed RNA polymerase subunit L
VSLTPYDTGDRLEPKPWHVQPLNLPSPEEADRYGRVDFDNDSGETVLTACIERKEGKSYTLHAYVHGIENVQMELTLNDQESLLLQPSAALQEKVRQTIDELSTETERIESEVYWQQGKALILVAGETGYRKQQAIIVYEPGCTYGVTMSAKVGKWADGVRDTRIG